MQYPMLFIMSVTHVPLPGAVALPVISKFTTWSGFRNRVHRTAGRQWGQAGSPQVVDRPGTIYSIELYALYMHPLDAVVVSHPAGHHPAGGGHDNPMAEFEAKMEQTFGNGWDCQVKQ